MKKLRREMLGVGIDAAAWHTEVVEEGAAGTGTIVASAPCAGGGSRGAGHTAGDENRVEHMDYDGRESVSEDTGSDGTAPPASVLAGCEGQAS